MHHFDELVLDMVGFRYSIVVCGESGSTDKYIPYTDFTSPVGLSVITGKTLYHHACKFVFFTHENSLVGDEYIVKYHKSFMSTEL